MTVVGEQRKSARAVARRDYAVVIAMLVEGVDPAEVSAITGLPMRDLLALWHAIDGEASGTMRRFGSVIDPRYRPRSEPIEIGRLRRRAKLHLPTC